MSATMTALPLPQPTNLLPVPKIESIDVWRHEIVLSELLCVCSSGATPPIPTRAIVAGLQKPSPQPVRLLASQQQPRPLSDASSTLTSQTVVSDVYASTQATSPTSCRSFNFDRRKQNHCGHCGALNQERVDMAVNVASAPVAPVSTFPVHNHGDFHHEDEPLYVLSGDTTPKKKSKFWADMKKLARRCSPKKSHSDLRTKGQHQMPPAFIPPSPPPLPNPARASAAPAVVAPLAAAPVPPVPAIPPAFAPPQAAPASVHNAPTAPVGQSQQAIVPGAVDDDIWDDRLHEDDDDYSIGGDVKTVSKRFSSKIKRMTMSRSSRRSAAPPLQLPPTMAPDTDPVAALAALNGAAPPVLAPTSVPPRKSRKSRRMTAGPTIEEDVWDNRMMEDDDDYSIGEGPKIVPNRISRKFKRKTVAYGATPPLPSHGDPQPPSTTSMYSSLRVADTGDERLRQLVGPSNFPAAPTSNNYPVQPPIPVPDGGANVRMEDHSPTVAPQPTLKKSKSRPFTIAGLMGKAAP